MSSTTTIPEVLWAQRSSTSEPEKNVIFLTISATDVPKIDVDLKSTSLTFTGTSTTKKTTYHLELEFWGEINVENSKTHHTSSKIEFVLRKKEMKEEYWPRLLKESKKVHFLKTDFDKWVDEDEQNAAPDDADLGGMGGGMGGMPGMEGMGGMGGMPGMGGMGGDGGFGGIDFSKLGGGAGGMPGLGDMGDMGGMGEGDEDDDDDMPALEDEAPAAEKSETPAGKATEEKSETAEGKATEESAPAKSKIEEVS